MQYKHAVDGIRVLAVVLVVIGLTYGVLRAGVAYGPGVLAMGLVPLAVARLASLRLGSLIPDMLFGAIDSGLLVLAATLGAAGFGIAGAIVGGVVGDALTDGIAGFCEGGIAEWLRSRGIEENRTALGSALGKMSGCLAGSGSVLCCVQLLGFQFKL